jgi:hypothetical protein
MVNIGFFENLVESYLDGQMSVDEFEQRYKEAFNVIQGKPKSEAVWVIIATLWSDIDWYEPRITEDEEYMITEKTLRERAREALDKLRALTPEERGE